jgi:hypothetical protein
MRIAVLAAVLGAFAPCVARAESFCEQFGKVSAEKQGAYVLFVVDHMLKDWPQYEAAKRLMTDDERLATFSETRKQMAAECAAGKEFAAGVSFGEQLALYKMTLIEMSNQLKHQPER